MNQLNSSKRIEYLDALRGFTMILVVLAHISTFALKGFESTLISYHRIFAEFRMPLFFFVSGFVFYKTNMIWSINNICSFLKKKINVQIISPTIFLITYTIVFNINIESAFLSEYKYGYWFTFTLFYFFVLYIFLYKILYITCWRN